MCSFLYFLHSSSNSSIKLHFCCFNPNKNNKIMEVKEMVTYKNEQKEERKKNFYFLFIKFSFLDKLETWFGQCVNEVSLKNYENLNRIITCLSSLPLNVLWQFKMPTKIFCAILELTKRIKKIDNKEIIAKLPLINVAVVIELYNCVL